MNFLNGRVLDGGKVSFAGVEVQAPFAPGAAKPGDSITIGLRPEHFVPPAEASASLEVTADFIEHLGGTNFVHGHVATGEQVIVEHRAAIGLRTETTVKAGFAASSLLAFDAQGERLR